MVELEFENVDPRSKARFNPRMVLGRNRTWATLMDANILTTVPTLLPRREERKANLTGLQAENKASKALGHAASIPETMNIILYNNNTKFEGGKENGKVPSRDLTWPASPLPVSSSVACQS